MDLHNNFGSTLISEKSAIFTSTRSFKQGFTLLCVATYTTNLPIFVNVAYFLLYPLYYLDIVEILNTYVHPVTMH